MEFEERNTRRPLPRQMDVSDWNVDIDVRSNVSSALGTYGRERSAMEDSNRRASSGEELRSMLRPVNRYDASMPSRADAGSVWRGSESTVRTAAPRSTSSREPTIDVDPSSQRPLPRSMPGMWRGGSSFPVSRSLQDSTDSDLRTRLSALASARESSPPTNNQFMANSTSQQRASQPVSTTIHVTPPREQMRHASPTSTVRSDASTVLTSSPFTASITDTPTSITRSIPSPPFTPSTDARSSHDPTPESTPPQYSYRTSREMTSASIIVSSPPQEQSEAEPRSAPTLSLVDSTQTETPSTFTLTPREQREQLYAFRRDMCQIFARVDEMVDVHRDMFKCDPMSGMPAFDATIACETATFTNETFEQLTNLRKRFGEMTASWAIAATASMEQPLRPRRQFTNSVASPPIRAEESVNENMSSISSHPIDNDGPIEEDSSIGSKSPTTSSTRDTDLVSRPMYRWQSSLLTSNDDASSSASDRDSSSLPSELPTISRPSTASSSELTTRPNIFEDFDRRMEEIRASLNAIVQDKPRSPRPMSTTTAFESRIASTMSEDESMENNAYTANRSTLDPPTSTRHDREARLRQLLRELQSTSEHLDHGSSPRTR